MSDEVGGPAGDEARSGEPTILGLPILSLVRPLAGAAILATVMGRALGPSAGGIAVGIPRLSNGLERFGDLASQLFAMLATTMVVLQTLVVTRERISVPMRLLAMALGGFVVIVNVIATVYPVAKAPAALVAVTAGGFAILAALDGMRAPFARGAAVVVGLAGASSLLRLAGLGAAAIAAGAAKLAVFAVVARGLATASLVVDGAAIAAASAWVTVRSKRLATPATAIALLVAFLITRRAMQVDSEDVAAFPLLLRRAVERLLTRPEPFVPLSVRVFVSVLAPLVAGAALFARGRVPALSGALALALIVRGSAEMPLGAICLVVASLTLILGARDDRGVWAMIARTSSIPADTPPGGAAQAATGAEAERADRSP